MLLTQCRRPIPSSVTRDKRATLLCNAVIQSNSVLQSPAKNIHLRVCDFIAADIYKFITHGGCNMTWETPTYKDLRFGFEVTMYIYNR